MLGDDWLVTSWFTRLVVLLMNEYITISVISRLYIGYIFINLN